MSGGRVLLFGGTSEGRALAEWLAAGGVDVLLCVATQYGKGILQQGERLRVYAGRLESAEMRELMERNALPLVVDATHPYASVASDNIRAACAASGAEYLRVLRPASAPDGVEVVQNAAEAAQALARRGDKALLTVGGQSLEAFTAVPEYRERLFARVLPDAEVVARCVTLGFAGKHLIAMQGPFSRAMNATTLRDTGARCLVTKDSGDTGGLGDKLLAAEDVGARVILIGRPHDEEGLTREEAVAHLAARFDLALPPEETEAQPEPEAPLELQQEPELQPEEPLESPLELRSEEALESPPEPEEPQPEQPAEPSDEVRFPLFVDLRGKRAVVVGGGGVAARRVRVLREFGARVCVVSPLLSPALRTLAESGGIEWQRREYAPGDLAGAFLAVAATGERAVNRRVGHDAQARGIPVSVADRRGECSFFFPAVARGGGLVAGLVSERGEHGAVRRAAAQIRKLMGAKE